MGHLRIYKQAPRDKFALLLKKKRKKKKEKKQKKRKKQANAELK